MNVIFVLAILLLIVTASGTFVYDFIMSNYEKFADKRLAEEQG